MHSSLSERESRKQLWKVRRGFIRARIIETTKQRSFRAPERNFFCKTIWKQFLHNHFCLWRANVEIPRWKSSRVGKAWNHVWNERSLSNAMTLICIRSWKLKENLRIWKLSWSNKQRVFVAQSKHEFLPVRKFTAFCYERSHLVMAAEPHVCNKAMCVV